MARASGGCWGTWTRGRQGNNINNQCYAKIYQTVASRSCVTVCSRSSFTPFSLPMNCLLSKRLGLPGPFEVHPRSYYTYRLRGVVVHTGTANQGHYFSYIREPGNSSNSDNGGRWVRSSPVTQGPPAAGSSSTTSLSVSVDGSAESTIGDEAKEGGDAGLEGAAMPPAEVSCPDPDSDGGVPCATGIVIEGEGEEDRWCEFNDTIVKEWRATGGNTARDKDKDHGRMSGLEADCFGGQQNMQVSSDWRGGGGGVY